MSDYDRKDFAYRSAKREGLRSRAALKLRELDERFHLFASGQRVLELGCWPGGWLQIAAERVGNSGTVVGVDIVQVEPLPSRAVHTIEGDACDPDVLERALGLLGGPADLLLSDLAPKLSGIKVADRARHESLVEAAVSAAGLVLAPGGTLLVKLFSSCESQMTALLRSRFEITAKVRPGTTRKGSSELYAVARRQRTVAASSESTAGGAGKEDGPGPGDET